MTNEELMKWIEPILQLDEKAANWRPIEERLEDMMYCWMTRVNWEDWEAIYVTEELAWCDFFEEVHIKLENKKNGNTFRVC